MDTYLDIFVQPIGNMQVGTLDVEGGPSARSLAGYSSYVGRIERGEHNLTFLALVKLCRAMKCDVAALTIGLPISKQQQSLALKNFLSLQIELRTMEILSFRAIAIFH